MRLFDGLFTKSSTSKEEVKPYSGKTDCLAKSGRSDHLAKCETSMSDNPQRWEMTERGQTYISRITEIGLGKTDIATQVEGTKAHMTYQIVVRTVNFQYSLRKRYSEFHQFFQQIKRNFQSLEAYFPKKTYFASGTSFSVVSKRYEQLQIFLQLLLKQIRSGGSQESKERFIDFLDLINSIESRENSLSESEQPLSTHSHQKDTLPKLMQQLNQMHNTQQILHSISQCIEGKNKLTNQDLKALIVGADKRSPGLLSLALNTADTMKANQCLQLLLSYISPEKRTFSEKIFRIFESVTANHFSIKNEEAFEASNGLKDQYFHVLSLYLRNKSEEKCKAALKNSAVAQQYEVWKKLSEMSEGGNRQKSPSKPRPEQFLIEVLRKSSYASYDSTKNTKMSLIDRTREDTLQISEIESLEGECQEKEQKRAKLSFGSNMSTSELTLEEEWEILKSKGILGDCLQLHKLESYKDVADRLLQEIKSDAELGITLMSDKVKKMRIDFGTRLSLEECRRASQKWNKLVYDERYDQFTEISRVYLKLNGRQKIFKFKQEEETLEDSPSLKRVRLTKTMENSKAKSFNDKENNRLLPISRSQHRSANSFEEVVTLSKSSQNEQTHVSIELNFEGEGDYFESELIGKTFNLYESALATFLLHF